MAEIDLEIRLVDAKTAVDDTTVDYVPFGVKVLKLQVRKRAGPACRVWIRTKSFKRDEDPCAIYGYADDGEDLWAVWGAGDVTGFAACYAEDAGTKRPVALDDDRPHTVYLHLIHHPADPAAHVLHDRPLTVVAVTADGDPNKLGKTPGRERVYQDRILAEKTFTLTVPTGAADPCRPIWSWQPDASQIRLAGRDLPSYVPRWWPSRRVEYATMDTPPRVRLDYSRSPAGGGPGGAITAWLETESGDRKLAEVGGGLTVPLYDRRWFLPELYRFYDGRMLVLRLWFFWTDEHLDADDLLSFVPQDQKEALRPEREQEVRDLMKPRLFGRWPGWADQYEVPDVERFDIVFDPADLGRKFGCTDGHWQEFWFEVKRDEPCQCHIAAPKDAVLAVTDYLARYLKSAGRELTPITNPLEVSGVVETITQQRIRFDPTSGRFVPVTGRVSLDRGAGMLGKNAPSVPNSRPLEDGLSSDVLEG